MPLAPREHIRHRYNPPAAPAIQNAPLNFAFVRSYTQKCSQEQVECAPFDLHLPEVTRQDLTAAIRLQWFTSRILEAAIDNHARHDASTG